MWEKLEQVFEEIGLPYSRQGTYEQDEKLPDTFFTFWNDSATEQSYYNNKPIKCVWEWSIFFYTNNPELIYSKVIEFIEVARKYGFETDSKGRDIPTNEPCYYGRYLKIVYNENYSN